MKKQAPIMPRPDLFHAPSKPAQPRQYVTVKATGQRGYVWDGVQLQVQVTRGRVGVVIDGYTGPMQYFRPDELKEEAE